MMSRLPWLLVLSMTLRLEREREKKVVLFVEALFWRCGKDLNLRGVYIAGDLSVRLVRCLQIAETMSV